MIESCYGHDQVIGNDLPVFRDADCSMTSLHEFLKSNGLNTRHLKRCFPSLKQPYGLWSCAFFKHEQALDLLSSDIQFANELSVVPHRRRAHTLRARCAVRPAVCAVHELPSRGQQAVPLCLRAQPVPYQGVQCATETLPT